MSEKGYRLQENNKVEIEGAVSEGFQFSHEVFGEGFYTTKLVVERTSGATDIVPIMVSDRLLDVRKDYGDQRIAVIGQYRSFNDRSSGRSRLMLFVFAREAHIVEEKTDKNHICLEGFICRNPVYRETPLGKEITDLLIAVNRPYGKSDYIPCICWGRNAMYVGTLEIGTKVRVVGRIQSRVYYKELENGTKIERMAYEVSLSRVEEVKENAD